MSLEKELAANTEATQELTAVMKEVLATQKAALAKLAPSKSDDADEDEAPKTRRRSRDDDEDEAPKSRKSRSRDEDEDEDEAPKSKRRSRDADEDEEDEAPKSKRRSRDEDEDEDEAPKSKRRSRDADEDEEEDEKPKKKAEKADKPAKKGSKDKGPSLAAVRAAIADLMDCDKGDEEDRNDFIEAMYDHLEVANATEIDEKDFERVLEWIAKKKSGKKVKFD